MLNGDKCKKQNKRLTPFFKLTDKQRHSSAMGLLLQSPHLSNIGLFSDEQIQHDLEEDEGELGGPQRSGGLFSGKYLQNLSSIVTSTVSGVFNFVLYFCLVNLKTKLIEVKC